MYYLFLTLLLIVSINSASSDDAPTFKFQVGQQFSYSLNGIVDSRGKTSDDTYSPGSFGTMTADAEFLCQNIFSNGTYSFVMNMFDTTVQVGQDPVTGDNSIPVDMGEAPLGKKKQPLGEDIWFHLDPSGAIPIAWYVVQDDAYFTQIKFSAMNTLQTRLQAPGSPLVREIEGDVVGEHYSNFTADPLTSEGLAKINKVFDRRDVVSFADHNLAPESVDLYSVGHVIVHPDGYLTEMHVEHQVSLMDVDPTQAYANNQPSEEALNLRQERFNANSIINKKDKIKVSSDVNDDGTETFNTHLHSYGHLTLKLSQINSNSLEESRDVFSSLQDIHDDIASDDGKSANEFISLTPELTLADYDVSLNSKYEAFTFAQAAAIVQEAGLVLRAQDANIDEIVATLESRALVHELRTETQTHLVKILRSLPSKSDDLLPYIITPPNVRRLEFSLSTQLSIISALIETHSDVTDAHLISILNAPEVSSDFRRHTLSTLTAHRKPSDALALALYNIAFSDEEASSLFDEDHRHHAILCLGAILSRDSISASTRSSLVLELETLSISLLDQHLDNEVTELDIPADIFQGLVYNLGVNHVSNTLLQVASTLLSPIGSILSEENLSESLFEPPAGSVPFNKTETWSKPVGGNVTKASFGLELFAGTNFDCAEENFNYDAYAAAFLDTEVLFFNVRAFEARLEYGIVDKTLVAGNGLTLTVFSKVVKQMTLPQLDCEEHTYPFSNQSPGFTFSHTVWVSIVPVDFSAGLNLNLVEEWGWEVCDTTLYGMLEIIPQATVSVSGNVEINLLIIKAGASLTASMAAYVQPQGYVDGTKCSLGFDANFVTQPMAAQFKGYYNTQKCFLWIFDCHWNEEHDQVWWDWNEGGSTTPIFDKEWPVVKPSDK